MLSHRSLYRNAAAYECSHAVAGPGRHVVGYDDGEYEIIGLYFGHGPNGPRTLYYILRSTSGAGEGLRRWERVVQAAEVQP